MTPYRTDMVRRIYICSACGAEYPMKYTAPGQNTFKKDLPGIAWANFKRHLKTHTEGGEQLSLGAE